MLLAGADPGYVPCVPERGQHFPFFNFFRQYSVARASAEQNTGTVVCHSGPQSNSPNTNPPLPCVLATSGFIQHHTATNIGQRLVEISSFFGVVGRVQAVIHDEAANQVVALRVATDEYRKQYLGGSWTSIVCAAHSLQTCLKYGFNLTTIAALVSAGRKLVGQFRHSTKFKATHALITAQKPREQAHGQHRVQ